MSGLGVVLQESVRREREASRTILCFLREQMDVADEVGGRRRSLKERLGFKGMGCCGATWGFGPTTPISVDENDDDDQDQEEERHIVNPAPVCSGPDPDPVPPASPSMNLAAALAAERRLRASSDAAGSEALPGTPARVSLMRLLEETEGGGDEAARGRREGGGGSDWVCCVCMGRKKGAAFIPCGHTFCRVCSRELWLNRGSCPLCNRPILEILDIF